MLPAVRTWIAPDVYATNTARVTAPDVYAAVNTIGVVALYVRENIFRTSVGVCRAEKGCRNKRRTPPPPGQFESCCSLKSASAK